MDAGIERAVGQNLRRIREAAGLTQEAVAVQLQLRGCDITRSAVAKIEVGQRHLYPDEIIYLRDILGTTYDKIFAVSERDANAQNRSV
ncbi:MAG TPA: transcriptional regulator [Clostridiales bacterium]|nr:transcriptional regulator [Clostridiales bacterium]